MSLTVNRLQRRHLTRSWVHQLGLLIGCLSIAVANVAAAEQLPHIVVIYADDLGYGDVSCYNPDRGRIHTPNIDRLAAQGMRFTDAHSSSGVCSPSRYTLLTGRYHWRTRLQSGIVGLWEEPLIAEDRLTVATLLRRHGYQTACVGKWHLGWDWAIPTLQESLFRETDKGAQATDAHQAAWQYTFSQAIEGGPITRGFETYFGTDVPNWPPFCFIENNRTVGIPSQFLPAHLFLNHLASRQGPALADWQFESILPALRDRACELIAAAAQRPEPLFLYLPLTSPHTPLAVNEPWRGRSGLGTYADLVLETDDIVGRVLDCIQQQGLAENTLVLFTSDNGCAPYIGVAEMEQQGHFPSGPLRGYKSDAWEGGHRVPFIVRWPGKVACDTRSSALVHQADLMATCADIVGASLPATAGEDSVSLLPVLRGQATDVRKTAVSQSSGGLLAIRRGPWKLIFGSGSGGWTKGEDDQPIQLYHLENDLGERTNLAAQHPEIVTELTRLMDQQVAEGRSTPGKLQPNDAPIDWHP